MSLEKKNEEIINNIQQETTTEEVVTSKRSIRNVVIAAAIGVAVIVGGASLLFGGSDDNKPTDIPVETTEAIVETVETVDYDNLVDIEYVETTAPETTEVVEETVEETIPETTETTPEVTEPAVKPTEKPVTNPTTPTVKPETTPPEETEPVEESTVPATTAPAPITVYAPVTTPKTDREMLACVIYQEAGANACCDNCRRRVADVVLNRVASSSFPNTIRGVLTQKRQYGRFYWTGVVWPSQASTKAEKAAVERAYRIADEVLSGNHSSLYGKNYIWQAEFKQGKDSVYCCGIYFGRS